MKWKWPLVTRSRYDALDADRERVRGERDQFAKDRDAQRAVARKAARQFTSADEELIELRLVNDRLTDANLAVARRLARALRACARYRTALDKTATEWMAECQAHALRADRLQRRLDDSLGLNTAVIALGETWQDRREQKMRYDA